MSRRSMRRSRPPRAVAAALGWTLLVTAGCATRSYVAGEAARLRSELESQQVAAVPPEVELALEGYEESVRQELATAVEMAQLAEERAAEAERLARGEVAPEPAFTVGGLYFASGSAELGLEARSQLDQLAERLRIENLRSYLEIHGHADAAGAERRNLELAARRAEAVRRYLHLECGIPLHLLSVVAHGETGPPVDDPSPEAVNRRVVVAVLR